MPERLMFVRFVLSGGVAAAVNVVSRWLLSQVLVYEAAVLLAYMVGMAAAFILMRQFVFHASTAAPTQQVRRFVIVNIAAAAQVWLVSVGLARFIFPAVGFIAHAEAFAHLIGVTSPVLVSYFAHRWYSFG
jgi:putative flippase GtrA